LQDIAFPAGATVRLVSESGRLAPQPNTSQPVVTGFVNFVSNVTYAGAAAQDYVAASAGGTGRQPPNIVVTPPNP
jgi:hypothetical protein